MADRSAGAGGAPDRAGTTGPWGVPAAWRALALRAAAREGVRIVRLFRTEGLMVRGKLFAFVSGDRVVCKLPAAARARELAAGRAEPWGPAPGRRWKEWVAVGMRDAAGDAGARLDDLVAAARAHVEAGTGGPA